MFLQVHYPEPQWHRLSRIHVGLLPRQENHQAWSRDDMENLRWMSDGVLHSARLDCYQLEIVNDFSFSYHFCSSLFFYLEVRTCFG